MARPTSAQCSCGHVSQEEGVWGGGRWTVQPCLICSPGRETISQDPRPFWGPDPRSLLTEMKPWQVLQPHPGSGWLRLRKHIWHGLRGPRSSLGCIAETKCTCPTSERSCLRTWLPRSRNCLLADINLPREANISRFSHSGPELREDGGSWESAEAWLQEGTV